MKSISARQFRTSFADLTEPVTVLRRDGAGNFQVLGEWHPQSGGAPVVRYDPGPFPSEPRVSSGPSFGVPKAAPKPGGK